MTKKRKKKKWKKLKWFLLSVCILVLAIGGYILYEFKFKTYDVADDEVEAILDEGYTLHLPDGTTAKVDDTGKLQNETISGQFKLEGEDVFVLVENNQIVKVTNGNGEEIKHNTVKPNLSVDKEENKFFVETESGDKVTVTPGQSQNTKPNVEQKPTVASIKAKYVQPFNELQSQVESKLGTLIARAQAEYISKKANGESIQFGYFYNKYVSAASSMEAGTDAAFNSLIAVLEAELEQNGYDQSYAESFRNEYKATKESFRSDLYAKAMSMK